MEFTSGAPYISEWISLRGAIVLISELGKSSTWLLPYWQAEQKFGVLFIEELQTF